MEAASLVSTYEREASGVEYAFIEYKEGDFNICHPYENIDLDKYGSIAYSSHREV